MAKTTKPSTGAKNKAPVSSKDVKAPVEAKPTASATGTPKLPAAKVDVKTTPDVKPTDTKPSTVAQDAKTQSTSSSTPPKGAGMTDTAKKPDAKPVDTSPKKVETNATTADAAKPNSPKPAQSSTPVKVASTPQPATAEKQSVFLPVLLGVAGAAVLGFLASEFNVFGLRSESVDLSADFARQQEQIAALEKAQSAIVMPDIDGLTQQVETQIGGVTETVAALEARVADVEQRPVTGDTDAGKAAFAAFETQFNELKSSIETQSAEVAEQKSVIDGLLTNAQSAQQAATDASRAAGIQVALAKVSAAVSAGQPFAPALAELETAGGSDIPAALLENSETGVPTLASLQADFPAMARAALKAARVVAPTDGDDGVAGFFKRQLGARSVAPREGSDPDAVLSRAEAAVANGALTDALTEIDTLPPEAQAEMEDWLASARARQAAEAAAQDLSQRLMAN